MLRLELAQLRADQRYGKLRKQVRSIASMLEEVANIPLVREQLALLQDLQSDEWWQDVTVPMLDNVRKRLRALVKLIERRERHRVYTNFEDVLGEEELIGLPGLEAGVSYELFRQKAQQFLREHETHITVHKLRWNKPLTPSDLSELEQMLLQAGVGTAANVTRAKQESHGLGLFIRSLTGLDREAAKQAFSGFLGDKTLSANQIEFVNLIIDHLTQHGIMEPGLLYESPYTDISGLGPEGVFSPSQVETVVTLLTEIRQRAAA
jgi:type I restriction enzyme, R subunit